MYRKQKGSDEKLPDLKSGISKELSTLMISYFARIYTIEVLSASPISLMKFAGCEKHDSPIDFLFLVFDMTGRRKYRIQTSWHLYFGSVSKYI